MTILRLCGCATVASLCLTAIGCGKSDADREMIAKVQLSLVESKVSRHELTHGVLPNSLGDVKNLQGETDRQDPWKQGLVYVRTGDKFSLCSNGPDRQPGTGDDICYAETP